MSPLHRLFFVLILFPGTGVFAQDPTSPKVTKDDPLPKSAEDQQDVAPLRKITDRTFVHEGTQVSFTVPEGWKEIKPQRLARKIDPRVIAVVRIEEPEKDIIASLYWLPMNPGQKMSDWVRDTPSNGEFGEEYETLKAVYGGPPKISLPTKSKTGVFEIYRIDINGGQEKGDRYDGVLYLTEVKSGSTNWLLKARISFPKGARAQYDPYALEVLKGYAMMPEGAEKK